MKWVVFLFFCITLTLVNVWIGTVRDCSIEKILLEEYRSPENEDELPELVLAIEEGRLSEWKKENPGAVSNAEDIASSRKPIMIALTLVGAIAAIVGGLMLDGNPAICVILPMVLSFFHWGRFILALVIVLPITLAIGGPAIAVLSGFRLLKRL